MAGALAVVVLPSVAVLLYTGEWMGLGVQVVFLVLAGALVRTGAEWARWGLAVWFGLAALIVLLAGFVAAALSLRPSIRDVAPHLLLGVLYGMFAVVFALSLGIGRWLDWSRRSRGREGGNL
jgi:hypothetical protein